MAPALIRLGIEEVVAIVGRERPHHRMLGHIGLEKDLARPLGPARATRHLMQELEGALRRAQVPAGEPEIGVHHAHQREQRKVVTLRHHLGPDQYVDRVRFDAVDQLGHRAGARERVARDDREARRRESCAYLLGKTLDTGTAGRKCAGGSARRTKFGHFLEVAAMMALQLPHEPVLHKPSRAIRALEPVPTTPAERERRIAATIQEQHHLLARLQGRVQGRHQRRR